MNRSVAPFILALAISCQSLPSPDGSAPAERAQEPTSAAPEPTRQPEKTDETFETRAEQLAATAFSKIKKELFAALAEGGPPNAIGVCRERTFAIAESLSTEELTIRRIGTRVRNKKVNTPTAEERDVLAKLTRANPTWVGELGGKKTYMKGIFIPGTMCLQCHGSHEDIAPATKEAIERLYPTDDATGYAVGDLRGAFVVEQDT